MITHETTNNETTAPLRTSVLIVNDKHTV